MRFCKKKGFTITETIVAIALATIFLTSTVGVLGQIFYSQKKISVAQNFYDESRFLMERIVRMVRENTIDYDKYFEEIGPNISGSNSCSELANGQTENGAKVFNLAGDDAANLANKTLRKKYNYADLFYWNIDNEPGKDRHLGGFNNEGDKDPCTVAFKDPEPEILYLINSSRTVRTSIKKEEDTSVNPNTSNISLKKEIGADIDNDNKIDLWGSYGGECNDLTTCALDQICSDIDTAGKIKIFWDDNVKTCNLCYFETTIKDIPVEGNFDSEIFCKNAHNWTPISPKKVYVDNLKFRPSPTRDPYLAFRVDEAQIHPHVFVSLSTSLDIQNRTFGFTDDTKPKLDFQTMASSRIFGDTR